MARNDFLSQLAKKSLGYKLMVLLVAMVLGGALYFQFSYSPGSDELEQLESSQSNLLAKQRQLDKDLAEMRRLAGVYAELQQSIRDNQRALPTEAELPAFFDHLQRKAADAGVTIRRWGRLEEEGVDMYVRVPVSVEINGTYFNIMKYFFLLGPPQGGATQNEGGAEPVRINERIVSVEDFVLDTPEVSDTGEVTLTAKFTASTFRQATASEATGAAAPGAAPAGAAGKGPAPAGQPGAAGAPPAGQPGAAGGASAAPAGQPGAAGGASAAPAGQPGAAASPASPQPSSQPAGAAGKALQPGVDE